MEGQYNLRSPSVKRLMREAQELREPTELFHAQPLEDNLFEWHFTLRGPGDTEFEGGIYHGRIILPPEYPMKPPSIILLTPNGRFETHKKICLSISGHHPESWQPSWSIRTAMLAIIGFMPTHGSGAIGSLDYSAEERKVLARKTAEWKCPDCGSIKNILKPLTEASKNESQEAKQLAAQIDFKGENKNGKKGGGEAGEEKSTSEAAATESASSSPEGATSPPTPGGTTSPPVSPTPGGTTMPPFSPFGMPPMMPPFMPQMMPRPPGQAANQGQAGAGFPFWPSFNPMMMRPPTSPTGASPRPGQMPNMSPWAGSMQMYTAMMAQHMARQSAGQRNPTPGGASSPATSGGASSTSTPIKTTVPQASNVPTSTTTASPTSATSAAPSAHASTVSPTRAPTSSTSASSSTTSGTPPSVSQAGSTSSPSSADGLRQRSTAPASPAPTPTPTPAPSSAPAPAPAEADLGELHPLVPHQSENPWIMMMMLFLGLAIIALIARRLYLMNVWRLDTDY